MKVNLDGLEYKLVSHVRPFHFTLTTLLMAAITISLSDLLVGILKALADIFCCAFLKHKLTAQQQITPQPNK